MSAKAESDCAGAAFPVAPPDSPGKAPWGRAAFQRDFPPIFPTEGGTVTSWIVTEMGQCLSPGWVWDQLLVVPIFRSLGSEASSAPNPTVMAKHTLSVSPVLWFPTKYFEKTLGFLPLGK